MLYSLRTTCRSLDKCTKSRSNELQDTITRRISCCPHVPGQRSLLTATAICASSEPASIMVLPPLGWIGMHGLRGNVYNFSDLILGYTDLGIGEAHKSGFSFDASCRPQRPHPLLLLLQLYLEGHWSHDNICIPFPNPHTAKP